MVGILLLDWAWAWGGGPGSPPGFPSKLVVPELDVVRRVVARAGAAQAAEVLAGWVVGGDGARRPVAGAIGFAHRAHQLGVVHDTEALPLWTRLVWSQGACTSVPPSGPPTSPSLYSWSVYWTYLS